MTICMTGLFINVAYAAKLNPSKTTGSIQDILAGILIKFIFPLAFGIAVGAIIYAGVLYITSQGDPEKLSKAKKALLYSFVGILIVALSWAIVLTLSGGFLNKVL